MEKEHEFRLQERKLPRDLFIPLYGPLTALSFRLCFGVWDWGWHVGHCASLLAKAARELY